MLYLATTAILYDNAVITDNKLSSDITTFPGMGTAQCFIITAINEKWFAVIRIV